jgi:hypothetical protein
VGAEATAEVRLVREHVLMMLVLMMVLVVRR